MDDLFSCDPEGQPFASKKNCVGHEPHELPGRDMISRQKREGRKNNQGNPGRPSSPRRHITYNVIATSMSCDPAIASIQEFAHAGQSCERDEGPGPPDLAGEKNHGSRTADVAAVAGQDAHLFQGRARLKIEPLHDPVCVEREKKEPAAAKYSIESSGGGGAGSAIAVV
jgi:hypothetical protein